MSLSSDRRAVFNVMNVTVSALHVRASYGVFKYNDAPALGYLKACRLVAIDVGASVLFCYEDLATSPKGKEVIALNPRLRFQAHVGIQAVPGEVIRKHKAKNPEWRQVDDWGEWQLSLWLMTFFPDAYRSTWCELFESPVKGSVPSFHGRLVVHEQDGGWSPTKGLDLNEQAALRKWGWQPYEEYFHRVDGQAPH